MTRIQCSENANEIISGRMLRKRYEFSLDTVTSQRKPSNMKLILLLVALFLGLSTGNSSITHSEKGQRQ